MPCRSAPRAERIPERVHALVREPHRLGRARRLVRDQDGAVAGRHAEGLALLLERVRDEVREIRRVGVVRDERGELRAVETVGGATRGDEPAEVAADPAQEGVAGGPAEGVVVVLEADEVEDDQLCRRVERRLAVDAGELHEERVAVGELGERVEDWSGR